MERLTEHLPLVRPRLLTPLVCALVGMSHAVSSHQGKIAAAMPLMTTQQSKIQRFRRLLSNPKLTPEAVYHPIIRHALAAMTTQRVNLLLDRVVLTAHLNVLVVSLGYRRRSLPLFWKVLAHAGSSSLPDQQEALQTAAALLPSTVRITVHADSEFRSYALFAWIRAQDWHAMLGVRGNLLVRTAPDAEAKALHDWLPGTDTRVFLNEMWVRDDRNGPVNLLAWWDTNDRGDPIVYGVMTDLPATWQTFQWGKRRMWIETLFRDWQSGGFALGTTALRDAQRFSRLLILIGIVYGWFVSVGRWVVKRGYRTLIDAGPSRQWQCSLFTLAIAWQNRQHAFGLSMPVRWKVYF
ncbi:hypothetical protein F8S13_27595 [Chloroflexia bacterium SDU3-3]|nr:hypothetical protein F8S13_27595 [Chloroflexia bacterium SDU3-3]